MRTENLAIVFVDIAGYTPRTSSQTREENLCMLRRFDEIVRPLVRAYNGRVIKTIGDAYLLTFRSPTDALLCSMGIQDRIVETDREVNPSDHFTVRAAVNAGDVRIEGGDIFGEAVNIAARIEGKAGAGDIFFSEAVFLSMTKSEVPYEEVGLVELKGISEKVRIFRVPRAGQKEADSRQAGAKNADLPYGGRGLDRVRDKMNNFTIAPIMDHAENVLSNLPGTFKTGMASASRGVSWWKSEVRRSRSVQYGTIVLVIVLLVGLVWALKPAPRKANPIQKLHKALGL